jgi:anaerobic magnesium-protoporphyrin IX monomethyl ester cyclase
MARLVLVTPPVNMRTRYGLLAGAAVHMPPHGPGHLASWARSQGHSCCIIDSEALQLNEDEVVRKVLEFKPDLAGISAVTMTVHSASDLIMALQQAAPLLPVVLGGVHISALPEETMEKFPHICYGIIGEGEEAVLELLSACRGEKPMHEVDGLIFRDEERRLVRTRDRKPIQDIDRLPYPAWDLYPDLKKYYKPAVFGFKRLPNISVVTSRGCPFRCSFCSRAVWGEGSYRTHSAAYIFGMFRELRQKYGIRDISVYDDTFGVNSKRLREFCDMLIRAKLDVVWSCNLRANIADIEILKLMKKAGCWMVAYGIESGHQGNLDFLKKNVSREMIAEAMKMTRAAGMLSKGYIMVGTLPDTHESLQETLKLILKTPIDVLTVNAFTPMPGSLDYERADAYGTFNRDWRLLNQHSHVFTPSGLKNEDIDYYIRRFTRKFYFRFRPALLWKYFRLALHPVRFVLLVKGFFTLLRFVTARDNTPK